MNSESQQILVVNSQDISCERCHEEYASITNEPLILDCGCPICSLCEEELDDPKHCPLCKKELLRPSKKNQLFSQLLKSNYQAPKCPTHQLPYDFKKKGELHCSQCFLDKQKVLLISKEEIWSRLEELKNSGKKEEEKFQKALKKKVTEHNLNFKRKLDDLDAEMFGCILGNTKRLKIERDMEMFTALDQERHQVLAPYLGNVKMLKDDWERNEDLETAVQILKTPLAAEKGIGFSETVEKIKEKNEKIENQILESKKKLFEKTKQFWNQFWSQSIFNQKMIESKAKQYPEIARQYLLETFENYGFYVKDKGDCIELEENVPKSFLNKFYPEFFWFSIENLNVSCDFASAAAFQTICEILQNIQTLSELALSLDLYDDSYSFLMIESILSLIHCSKALQNFSCKIDDYRSTSDIEEFIKRLLNSNRISSLTFKYAWNEIIVDLRQNQLQPHGQEASIKELNLVFANTSLLEGELTQIIPEFINNSNQLKTVSLFLAGKELSECNILNRMFSLSGRRASCQHHLEEFSLTLLLYSEIGVDIKIKMIFYYLHQFPQLKNVELIINLVDNSPQKLIDSLERIIQQEYLPLLNPDVNCRPSDFSTASSEDGKVYQEILRKGKIPCQIAFGVLESEDLSKYFKKVFPQNYQKRYEEKKNQGNQNDVQGFKPSHVFSKNIYF